MEKSTIRHLEASGGFANKSSGGMLALGGFANGSSVVLLVGLAGCLGLGSWFSVSGFSLLAACFCVTSLKH